jgi:hypothetical protein
VRHAVTDSPNTLPDAPRALQRSQPHLSYSRRGDQWLTVRRRAGRMVIVAVALGTAPQPLESCTQNDVLLVIAGGVYAGHVAP